MCAFFDFEKSGEVRNNIDGEYRCGAFVIAYWLGMNNSSDEAKILNYNKNNNGYECEKIINWIYYSNIQFSKDEIEFIKSKNNNIEIKEQYTNPLKMSDYIRNKLETEITVECLNGYVISDLFKCVTKKFEYATTPIFQDSFSKMEDGEKIIIATKKDKGIPDHYIFAYKDKDTIQIMDPGSNNGVYTMNTAIENLKSEKDVIEYSYEKDGKTESPTYNFGGFIIRKGAKCS